MSDAIKSLIDRWATSGLPFKGELISDDGCMCAQGQALHFVGNYSADDLRAMSQAQADKETARVLGISTTHAVLLRQVNDSADGAPSVVLTHPEKVLGDQAHIVLAFWKHIDDMPNTAGDAAGKAAGKAAWVAAGKAAWVAAGKAAWVAAWVTAEATAWAAAGATNEIQGAEIMRAKNQPFYFLPLFGFATPEAIMKGGAA